MIKPSFLFNLLIKKGVNFYSGVPDSLLKDLCAYITDHSSEKNHIIAANEGGAMGLAAGYYLSTGKIPVIYMQNSGLGNTVNPLLSLMDKEVYRIPALLIIGWRGEPGVHDEPQHIKQGEVTIPLLEAMNVRYEIMEDEENVVQHQINRILDNIKLDSVPYALIVRKGAFESYKLGIELSEPFQLSREDAVKKIVSLLDNDIIVVSTTGMLSRELFEYRENHGQDHRHDFLTVGSMGHASQIALGIALNKPEKTICCFDGDGAVIMHLGALGIIGSLAPHNFYHFVFNNGSHDSVGGQPTIGRNIDFVAIAKGCGYKTVMSVETNEEIETVIGKLRTLEAPALLEINVHKGARSNLGRPTTTPIQNKDCFMEFLNS